MTRPPKTQRIASVRQVNIDILSAQGWIIVRHGGSSSHILSLAQSLGRVITPPNRPTLHRLKATAMLDAVRNSYSGRFGYGQFPFHTDMANWTTPPRYVLLRHYAGDSSIPTLLLDSQLLLSRVGREKVKHGIWSARARHRSFVLNLLSDRKKLPLFRWDPCTLVPLSEEAKEATDIIFEEIERQREKNSVPISFDPEAILVIDNWRTLHARPAIPIQSQNRELERVLVSGN